MKTIVTLLAIAIIIGAMMINVKMLHDLVAPEEKKTGKRKNKRQPQYVKSDKK